MTYITNFLTGVVSFFGSIVALLVNLTSGTAQLLEMLPNAVAMLNYSLASMPTVLFTFAYAMITVSIVYLIVGR